MNGDLHAAVLAAIRELAEAGDVLDLVATAAVDAVAEAGYFHAAGTEYAVRLGDVIAEAGFNTDGQARAWADTHLPQGTTFEVQHRPVGVWAYPTNDSVG